MTARIHPSAVVDPKANLAGDVEIGPYCVVGPRVTLGAGTRLMSHVVVDGLTSLGEGCVVFPFASVGLQTQDLKFKGGHPGVKIGHQVTIRESVTIHAATFDGDFTTIGDHCHIMAYVHIAHDCHIGNRVIMANVASLSGHVIVEDQAVIGGMCGIHQFVKIGRLSMIGGLSRVVKDVPPFMLAEGNPLSIHTINKLGIERAGISAEAQAALKEAYKIVYRRNLTTDLAIQELMVLGHFPEVEHLTTFIRSSERGIVR